MNVKENVVQTLIKYGLKPHHLVFGNLAGDGRKELRRALVWGITGNKPTLAESRLGIVQELLFKIFDIDGACSHDMDERLLARVKEIYPS
jgi:hypothetical protein